MKKKNTKIPIIYEDSYIIVIDKPAGMLSVSTDKETQNTAYRTINDYVKSRHKANRIWIVHRLDRDTSGVMLFAKSERVKLALQDNWEEMAIGREYVAVVSGHVRPVERKITSWLKQTKTLLVYSSNREGDGKIAITNYKVRKCKGKYSLLDISLETGRKNQIRVHMKDIGHSIVGDKKYTNTNSTVNPFGRLGLHASALTVKHPASGEEMRFESAIPKSFMNFFYPSEGK
ncbi:MAG: RNA pseudouridine synthase [Oscillospiraceae bacterium]|nr:RNA pseudouridine synthase [Oscillospiraceae bacterium]